MLSVRISHPGPAARAAFAVLAALASFVVPAAVPAQETTGTVLGRVLDDEGIPVFAATLFLTEGDGNGRVLRTADSDRLGFFRLDDVTPGRYELATERLGYAREVADVTVAPGGESRVDIVLPRAAVDLPGVRVLAGRSRERIRFEESAGATVREMSAEELALVPGVAEADPIRAVHVLPGVVSTSDFSSAFHVRGGSADQNLILLDGVPVFSPFHLGGFFSVFNADLIDRAELSSGGFPAEFGGRVSSVLAIETDPGDGTFGIDAGVSLLATRVAVAGGVGDGVRSALGLRNARWRASARRSYFDLLLKPFVEFPYHLQDFQGTFQAWTEGGDRLSVTAYSGDDVLDLTRLDEDDFPLRIDWGWGNDAVGARWVHPRRSGGSLEASAAFTRFGTGLDFPDFDDTEFRSEIRQALLAVDLDARPSGSWRLGVGGDLERYSYDNLATSGGTVFGRGAGSATLVAGHGQAEWRAPGRWLVEAGLRMDGWIPAGGDAVVVPAPRLAVKRFFAGSHWAVKAAAGRYSQFVHSLRDEELPLGLDVWILAGERAPHVVSDQVQVGVEGFLGDREMWQLSLEGYHRSFDGVVTFNPADDPNDDLDDVLSGTGVSWGADLLVRRTRGDVRGWLALSWLRATRTFPDLLSPEEPRPEITYPPVFDRRLDADLVLHFPAPAGWTGGLRLNVGTGVPYTRAVASYAFYEPRFTEWGGRLKWRGETEDFGGHAVALGARNAERYPLYHRLDVSFRKEIERSWGVLVPHVDILNVYNHRNVLFYFFEYDRDPPTRSGISMFPILPTAGLEIRF